MGLFDFPVAAALGAVQTFIKVGNGANKVMDIGTDVINKVSADSLKPFLDGLSPAMAKLKPDALLYSLGQVTWTVLSAIKEKVKQINIVRDGVMKNKLNETTINLLWTQRHELVNFIVDVVECAKCYVKSTSLDGQRDPLDEHGTDNELDLSMPMNQHALLCQAQRLIKSLVYLFTNVAASLEFKDIDMSAQTQLATDTFHSGTIIEVTPSGYQTVSAIPDAPAKGRRRDSGVGESDITMTEYSESSPNVASEDGNEPKASITDEKWLFVNGIGTELFWLHLACRKLARRLSRDVTGVYNRSDGILWDLIECAGQRTRGGDRCAESQKCIVQTTASSRAAQTALVNQLEDALVKAKDGETYKYVVMVAHSQGCLVLRLALEQLLNGTSESVKKTVRERLCVFTFGNPSVEWKIGSAQVLRTEHFANEKDFVAKLGVFYDGDQAKRGFKNVFVNKEKDWAGHLFGTQYSLQPQHYIDDFQFKGSNRSWLLNCLEGEPVDKARVLVVTLQRQLGLEALEMNEEMQSRLFATFANRSKPQHIHVKPTKSASRSTALPAGRLSFCDSQVDTASPNLDVPPFFCWESAHVQHPTINKRLQYNARTTVDRLLQYSISWAGEQDPKFTFNVPTGYQTMRKKTYEAVISTQASTGSDFSSQLHGVFSRFSQNSPPKLFSKYKSKKQKYFLDLNTQLQTDFEQYIEKLKQFLDLFIPTEPGKGNIRELVAKIWGETYYTAKTLNRGHEILSLGSSQSPKWFSERGCPNRSPHETLDGAFRHADIHTRHASRALDFVTDTALGPLGEQLQYYHSVVTTCLAAVEQLVTSGSYIRYGVARRDGVKDSRYALTESFKACFKLVVILVATLQKVVEHINSQYSEGSLSSKRAQFSGDNSERAGMERALGLLERIATDANVEPRNSSRQWEMETTAISKWNQSRSIALGPEIVLAWILRRQTVCDLKDNGTKLPRAVTLYENFMEKLRAKANRSPQKSLIRDINYLEEELEALNRVRQWQSEIIESYTTLLDDKTYRYVSGRRRLLFNLEEGILKSVQRQLSKDCNKLQDMLSTCQTLARRTQQNADINEETHDKAIYIFTVVTTVFLPLSFVTSFLGMNTIDIRDTEWGQELFWIVSMPITFVIMVLVSLVAYKGQGLKNISRIFQRPGKIGKRRRANLFLERPHDKKLDRGNVEAFEALQFESPFVYTKRPLLTFQVDNLDDEQAEPPANAANPGGQRKPTYVKVHKDHLAIETLMCYGLPWEWDRTDTDYIILLREMDPRETDILFEHTKRLREQASRSYSMSKW